MAPSSWYMSEWIFLSLHMKTPLREVCINMRQLFYRSMNSSYLKMFQFFIQFDKFATRDIADATTNK